MYAGPNTNGSQFFIVQNQHLPYSKKEIAREVVGLKLLRNLCGKKEEHLPGCTVFGPVMDDFLSNARPAITAGGGKVPWTNPRRCGDGVN